MILIALIRLLSTNKQVEDGLRKEYPKTNTRWNDVTLILSVLFILWNRLQEKFNLCLALLKTYIDY